MFRRFTGCERREQEQTYPQLVSWSKGHISCEIIVTINKGITWEKRSRAQRTNKNAAHVDPREVVRPRIADERPKDLLWNKERLEYIR